MRRGLLGWVALCILPGCATVMQGASQSVTVITDPAGATCIMEREGKVIGAVPATPGSVRFDKGKADIAVTCNLAGFDATRISHVSEFGGATLANAIVGGLIGVVVDAVSGANFLYPEEVRMILQPPGAPPVVQPTPAKVFGSAQTVESPKVQNAGSAPATSTKP